MEVNGNGQDYVNQEAPVSGDNLRAKKKRKRAGRVEIAREASAQASQHPISGSS